MNLIDLSSERPTPCPFCGASIFVEVERSGETHVAHAGDWCGGWWDAMESESCKVVIDGDMGERTLCFESEMSLPSRHDEMARRARAEYEARPVACACEDCGGRTRGKNLICDACATCDDVGSPGYTTDFYRNNRLVWRAPTRSELS